MVWRVVEFERTTNDLFDVVLSDEHVKVELLGFADLGVSTVTLSGCHIQGPGPNTMGQTLLRHCAQWVMELLDVDELRIEGASVRLVPIRDADPPPSFSGELVTLILRRSGKFDKRILSCQAIACGGTDAAGRPRRNYSARRSRPCCLPDRRRCRYPRIGT